VKGIVICIICERLK